MYELLKTQYREEPVNTLRKEGYVPGVVYGKGMESVSFKVNSLAITKFLHHSGKVFEVEIQGRGKHLVSLDNIQFDNMGDKMMHVAFHKISANEKTTVTLPIHFEGTAVGTKSGGIIQHVLNEVEVKGLPGDMPEYIVVDVASLDIHGHFCLKDIPAPKGLEWAHDIEANVVSCHPPKVEVVAEEVVETEAVVAEEVTTEDKQAA
ncbi:50S ribosomal protein L25 [Halobacteriovorax sp. HLS]|uniref:50S ribosomal protein L25 n=1 Tax=Halobacteriovorax sp. HLS TaxID=2234000 RepID=UPI0013E34D70|nr:50S ribosomal protein L25 [Halobacteriovorax sp. HLS]